MMTLHYTGRSILIPDDVCAALLKYAQALADSGSSDVVTVPVVAEGGHLVDAEFLVGPASQLYAMPGDASENDGVSADTVADLERRIRLLHPAAVISAAVDDPSTRFDLDN